MKNKSTKIILSVGAVVAVIVIAVLSTVFYFIPQGKYSKALSLKEQGMYSSANALFCEILDFKDSREQVIDGTIKIGENHLANGELEFALLVITNVHSEEADILREKVVEKYIENRDFAIAEATILGISSESRRQRLNNEILYVTANDLVKTDDIGAYDIYVELGDYKDSKQLAEDCKKDFFYNALYLTAIGKAISAEKYLPYLTDHEDYERLKTEVAYRKGLQLIKLKQYVAAEEIFVSLGDYKNSVKQLESVKIGKGLHNNRYYYMNSSTLEFKTTLEHKSIINKSSVYTIDGSTIRLYMGVDENSGIYAGLQFVCGDYDSYEAYMTKYEKNIDPYYEMRLENIEWQGENIIAFDYVAIEDGLRYEKKY